MNDQTNSPDKPSDSSLLSRRSALGLGIGAVASMAMLSLGGTAKAGDLIDDTDVATAPNYTDTEILNFALNLEYLEAEFYSYATTGKGISSFGVGVHGKGLFGPTLNGAMVDFGSDTLIRDVFNQIAEDERHHVLILRQALGSSAIAKPEINLAAGGNAFASVESLFVASRAFEDTGVSAYGGAAGYIMSKIYVSVAARILAIEAYHASLVRFVIAQRGIQTSKVDPKDVLPPPTGTRFFFEQPNGLSVTRFPQEVLAILYGGKPKTQGGFFPQGVNGGINRS